MHELTKTRTLPAGRRALTVLVCILIASSAFAGETAVEKLDLIRRIISERGEYDLAERQLREFVEGNKGNPVAAEALALLGYCLDKQKKNLDAAETYSRVAAEYPAAPEQLRADASLGAADAWFRLGRYRDAIASYGAVAELDGKPEQGESALLWRGEAEYRLALEEQEAGRGAAALLADAARDFTAFLEKYPDSKLTPSALSGAGFAFFDAGDYEKALENYRRFVTEFPDDRRAGENRYYIGESLYRLNRYDEAKTAFRDVLANDPGGAFAADARAGEAWADYGLRRVAEAAAGFEEAAALAGSDQELRLSLLYDAGCAWREAGEAQKAAQPFLDVARASDHPLNALAWFRLGTLWQEQARAARERAERAATPEDREKFAAMQKKLGEDAAQYFRRAIAGGRLGDEEIEARSLLGEVLLDAGQYEDAVREFGEIASRWPESERAPWALYHQALAERELSLAASDERGKTDRLARAAAALEKSLAYPAAKTRLQAAWALADYQNQLGNADAAREQYRWIANDAPAWAKEWKNPQGRPDPALENRAAQYAGDALFRLGESYYLTNDYSRAAGFYQEILAKHQGTPQAAMSLLRLGEIAEAGREPDVAQTRYEEALRLGMQLGRNRVGSTLGYAQLRLGTLLLRAGQKEEDGAARRKSLQEAARNLAAVLADAPEGLGLARPHYYLAEARYSLGQKKEALADYENSLKADEKGELADAALFGVAWSKRDLGDNEGALEAARKVIADFPDSDVRPDAFALMASIRRASGDAAGALADLDRFLEEYAGHPLSAKAELERASALDETGRHAEAAEAFRKFLSDNPEHPDAPQALYQRSWALWNRIKPQAQQMRAAGEALSDEVRKAEDEILASLRDLTGRHPDFAAVDAAWL
ncbi:MAG: tetratricopeptide repeat protein, partial [Planctomycetota bacterium]|nr:tetratricopeptide repeat protein [Planctomycetota bacterium]